MPALLRGHPRKQSAFQVGRVPEKAMTDAPGFALPDQSGARWTLADHLDAATVLVFYRGDW